MLKNLNLKNTVEQKNKKYFLVATLSLAVFLLTSVVCAFQPSYGQQQTQVLATLCDSAGPDVTITSPPTDSVVNTSNVNFTGIAQRTSQIDIFVNNVYSQSVAIGASPNFSTTVGLSEGTNTIKFSAFFSCNSTSQDVEVVVDYHIIPTPSQPGDTSSSTDQNPASGSVNSSYNRHSGSSDNKNSVIENIKDNLGLGDKSKSGQGGDYQESYVKIAFNWFIFSTILLLSGLLISSSFIMARIIAFLGIHKYTKYKHSHHIIRFILVLIIVILAFILAS